MAMAVAREVVLGPVFRGGVTEKPWHGLGIDFSHFFDCSVESFQGGGACRLIQVGMQCLVFENLAEILV